MNPHLERALLLYQQSRHEMAEEELRQALASEPDEAYAHALLSLCLSEREALDDATQEARQAIHLAPDFAFAHYAHARVLSDRNRYDEALAAVREAVRLEPEDAGYCALEAGIHFELKKWNEALSSAERGLQFDGEHSGCANLRAMALVKLGRKMEAGESIETALSRNPENALTHANRGWTFLEQNQPDQALHHFREALRLDPENEWARAGIIEAMKARNVIYGAMLRYFLWMAKLSPRAQWGIILGGYIGNRMLGSLAESNPSLAPWVWPLRILYLIFALLTWTADPLFNLLLRLNRFGRLVLSPEQILASNLVGACVLFALLSLASGLLTDWNSSSVIAAFVFGGLVIPLSAVFKCREGWPRTAMIAYTSGMALVGFGALGLRITADAKGGGSGALFALFLFGLFASGWIANILISQEPKR